MGCMKKMMKISSQTPLCEQAGRNTVESAICVIITSLAMVMAGSGSLEVLRVCRMLRKRVVPAYVTYGSHMAVSMSIGLLFLGGGRYSLSTSPEAIGALICAFFPVYPKNSRDNRYHLQAFRHLYILASEPRVIIPTDVDSGFPCYVPVEITFKDTKSYKNICYKADGPLILPELDRLKQVKILGPRYWPIVFDCDKNWTLLKNLLHKNGVLYVKQRVGHLSYTEDPKGYRGLLTKSLTSDQSSHVSIKAEEVKCFTSDTKLVTFSEYFTSSSHKMRCAVSQQLSNILYECVTQEKPEVIHAHIAMSKISENMPVARSTFGLWQVKLISAFYNRKLHRRETCLIQPEFLYATMTAIDRVFDKNEDRCHELLTTYTHGRELSPNDCTLLSAYLQWYDIPSPSLLTKLFTTYSLSQPQPPHHTKTADTEMSHGSSSDNTSENISPTWEKTSVNLGNASTISGTFAPLIRNESMLSSDSCSPRKLPEQTSEFVNMTEDVFADNLPSLIWLARMLPDLTISTLLKILTLWGTDQS